MKKQIKKLQIKTTILSILMIVFIITFSLILKNNNQNLQSKDFKIDILVNEIGELKNTLELQNKTTNKLMNTKKEIQKINNNLKNTQTTNKKRQIELKTQLENAEKNLTQLNKELTKKQKIQVIYTSTEPNQNKYNILLLGENQNLVDSILVISINKEKNTITTISIPRDLYYNGRKINALYKKYGIISTKTAIEKITGLKINNYAIWNFDSFKTLINALGGIKINVPKELNDKRYPGENNSYKIIKIKKGDQIMDGETSLIYARSRKSTSDFDRSKRQKLIIKSIIDKIKQLNLITKIELAIKIYAKIKPNLKTDIDLFQSLSIFNKYKNNQIKDGLTLSSANYLYSKISSIGQYILLPNNGNYIKIREKIESITN